MANSSLHGKKVLITSGPTREHIDPVRYISNESSGKQGCAIAEALLENGAEVTIISGPVAIKYPEEAMRIEVVSAQDMLMACEETLPVDIAICVAAVSDWRPAEIAMQKLKKNAEEDILTLKLVKNPDILAVLSRHTKRPALVVGFAAETENITENARKKLQSKGCDMILANDVSQSVFGADENTVQCITHENEEIWPRMTKKEVAKRLVESL